MAVPLMVELPSVAEVMVLPAPPTSVRSTEARLAQLAVGVTMDSVVAWPPPPPQAVHSSASTEMMVERKYLYGFILVSLT